MNDVQAVKAEPQKASDLLHWAAATINELRAERAKLYARIARLQNENTELRRMMLGDSEFDLNT